MERLFSKPPEARQVEARARARTYVAASQQQPGTVYAIERTPVGWACSCEGFAFTGCCKHLGAVERRSEREGWKFGAIAPLARVARHFPLDVPENVIKRGAVLSVAPVVAEEGPSAAPAPDLDALRERKRRALIDLYGPDYTAAD